MSTVENPKSPDTAIEHDECRPDMPTNMQAAGVDQRFLIDLALKAAFTTPQCTTTGIASQLHLPLRITSELLEQLRADLMLETLGQENLGYRYSISKRGRERAAHLFEICGYVGAAPVSLEAYASMLQKQIGNYAPILGADVEKALSDMVLPDETVEIAGLALSSGRSLFLSGPPGNGKTTLGRKLYNALHGTLWLPYCIVVDNNIIRLFDPQCHEAMPYDNSSTSLDQRWVRIRRPMIVAGGEMTLASLDLAYHPSLKYYEAPLHVKANGGIFLIDDFGRQHIAPEELLNRWIIPLEHQMDFLTLNTGQKIQMPFLLMLIIATNLNPADVTDPAFLRRIGYRLSLNLPTEDHYANIFTQYAARYGVTADPQTIVRLLKRYQAERRELRSCEPRDLIERARDLCLYMKQPFVLNDETIGLAWKGYFGVSTTQAA